jgi:hypothetical protein
LTRSREKKLPRSTTGHDREHESFERLAPRKKPPNPGKNLAFSPVTCFYAGTAGLVHGIATFFAFPWAKISAGFFLDIPLGKEILGG